MNRPAVSASDVEKENDMLKQQQLAKKRLRQLTAEEERELDENEIQHLAEAYAARELIAKEADAAERLSAAERRPAARATTRSVEYSASALSLVACKLCSWRLFATRFRQQP